MSHASNKVSTKKATSEEYMSLFINDLNTIPMPDEPKYYYDKQSVSLFDGLFSFLGYNTIPKTPYESLKDSIREFKKIFSAYREDKEVPYLMVLYLYLIVVHRIKTWKSTPITELIRRKDDTLTESWMALEAYIKIINNRRALYDEKIVPEVQHPSNECIIVLAFSIAKRMVESHDAMKLLDSIFNIYLFDVEASFTTKVQILHAFNDLNIPVSSRKESDEVDTLEWLLQQEIKVEWKKYSTSEYEKFTKTMDNILDKNKQ